MTKEELKNIIEGSYQRKNWIDLIKDVFNNGRFNAKPVEITLPKNDIAENAFELGSFETVDERIIGIYEIKIKKNLNLERNRVGLRQLLRSVYKQIDGAFIVFDQGTRWRFSYVSEISSRDANGKLIKSQTEPKRYTYLFGEDIKNRTAIERFFKLAGKPVLLDGIREAFSVDALTKEFYKELSDWYFWALQHVKFPDDEEKDKDVRNSTNTIRLITRLMFVWFLKQRGLIPEELFIKEEVDKLIKYNDKHKSTYYKAILQNLFFATLNTEMGDTNRKFVDRQYGIQGYYRYKRFFKDADRFLEVTKNVPFLNGGLFENLDKNVGSKDEKRIDCFSNRLENESRVAVPDHLFFGDDTVDLSGVYDDKKRSKVEVHGLINILKKYNFTIEENTPLDVEVALDPELLGKVFENLLASYNPETKSTARKQTGSFYTPREVVDYMVDESLKAYLLQNLLDIPSGYLEFGKKQTELLGNEGKKGQLSIKSEIKGNESQKDRYDKLLTSLLSYVDDKHGFNDTEVSVLISTIDNCKILDPACGSGAFPMGALHKMVHILHKLDPKNKLWKEKQLARVKTAREAASKIQDFQVRDAVLADLDRTEEDVKKAFENNELDYGRKLYLIENCIYGVDIQPIAVQIAKLRFFISLVVDQTIHENEYNSGIRPLPNLETKFVAANTLHSIDKGLGNLFEEQIKEKEKELKRVRELHFSARTPASKKRYRDQDAVLRKELVKLFRETGVKEDASHLLADWNPYDQNASSSFFDSEWMFGFKNDFNIVIGNPPYKILTKNNTSATLLSYYISKYNAIKRSNSKNLFTLFIENGSHLLGHNGVLSFIVPEGLFNTRSYGDCVLDLSSKGSVSKIVTFTSFVFENAVTGNLVFLFLKNASQSTSKFHFDTNYNIAAVKESENTVLKEIAALKTKQLGEVTSLFKGMVVSDRDSVMGEAKSFGKDIFLLGKSMEKWKITKEFYTDYSKLNIVGGTKRKEKHDVAPRIIIRRTGDVLCCTLLQKRALTESTLYSCWSNSKEFSNEYILGVLNSSMATYYIQQLMITNKQAFPQILMTDLETLPILPCDEKSQKIVSTVVEYILFMNGQREDVDNKVLLLAYFERVLNSIIYEIYFSDKVNTARCNVIQHLMSIPSLKNHKGEEERIIEQQYKTLYETNHPVRVATFKMDTIPEVAIIEGKKK